jgi:hypothetical protein
MVRHGKIANVPMLASKAAPQHDLNQSINSTENLVRTASKVWDNGA